MTHLNLDGTTLYPLKDLLNRDRFDFEYSPSSWSVLRRLGQIYSVFAWTMDYPDDIYLGEVSHGIQFYNFILFLGQTLYVSGCQQLLPTKSELKNQWQHVLDRENLEEIVKRVTSPKERRIVSEDIVAYIMKYRQE